MKKIPVWIDTDTGVDDAVALIVASKLDEIDLAGVSAVAGNTSLENAFRNARDVLSLVGRSDVKVYHGADRPLVIDLHTAEYVHGSNGLGGAKIPLSDAPIQTENAWDALYEAAKKYKGELVVCPVGPLTNIAIAIAKHPDIVGMIKELNVMGGALIGGNVTPCSEFNIHTDPHGAETVMKSGIHVNLFGLDVTHKAYLDDDDIDAIASFDNPVARLFVDSNHLLYDAREKLHWKGVCEHDSCPVIYTARPDWFKGHDCGIYVETQGTITFGKTVSDLWTDFKFEDRHCTAFLDVDRKKFASKIIDTYRSF
ncbi:MAG: nucleoside hydrolase [Erysipelotrichaceae bacterium]|nr:nucleoside hydrolase [Erysipelotrichaceae bacterium]